MYIVEGLYLHTLFDLISSSRLVATFLCVPRTLCMYADEAAAAATKLPNPAIFSGRPLPGLSVPDRMRVMPLKDVTALLAAAVEISSEGQSVQFAEFPNAIFERVRSYRHWFWAVNGWFLSFGFLSFRASILHL